jgi:hypothetical protein
MKLRSPHGVDRSEVERTRGSSLQIGCDLLSLTQQVERMRHVVGGADRQQREGNVSVRHMARSLCYRAVAARDGNEVPGLAKCGLVAVVVL